jgi:hypothetical protein
VTCTKGRWRPYTAWPEFVCSVVAGCGIRSSVPVSLGAGGRLGQAALTPRPVHRWRRRKSGRGAFDGGGGMGARVQGGSWLGLLGDRD